MAPVWFGHGLDALFTNPEGEMNVSSLVRGKRIQCVLGTSTLAFDRASKKAKKAKADGTAPLETAYEVFQKVRNRLAHGTFPVAHPIVDEDMLADPKDMLAEDDDD